MPSEFRLPALGADMDEGTILEWHVAPGARVKRGDVVAVVETDKGAIDVEIFMDGVVREIVVAPGTRIPVGTVLALVDTEVAATDRAAGTPTGAVPDRLKISPAARRRARELDVDVASLTGTGPGGAITVEDVERAGPSLPPSAPPAPERAPAATGEGVAPGAVGAAAETASGRRGLSALSPGT
jgi:pyruvate dehydrogenase E2 component (dihydrolipoamide acetyltransferase)